MRINFFGNQGGRVYSRLGACSNKINTVFLESPNARSSVSHEPISLSLNVHFG